MSDIPEQEEFVERRLRVPENEHYEHHMFIREYIDEQRRKRDRADRIKSQVGGWVIITVLGAVGTGAYNGWIYIKDHLK